MVKLLNVTLTSLLTAVHISCDRRFDYLVCVDLIVIVWLTAGVDSCFSVPLSCVSGYRRPEREQTGLWGDGGSREDEEFSVLTYEVRIIHSDSVALALFSLFNSQFWSCCRLSQWNMRLLFSLRSNEIRMKLTSQGSLVRYVSFTPFMLLCFCADDVLVWGVI